jgi:hypothetical protein
MKPVCLSRFLLTYLLPVIPLNIFYNGAASSLRSYSIPEIRELTDNLQSRDYEWECGIIPMGMLPQITYLLGLPR